MKKFIPNPHKPMFTLVNYIYLAISLSFLILALQETNKKIEINISEDESES
jgi:hypothetical protein